MKVVLTKGMLLSFLAAFLLTSCKKEKNSNKPPLAAAGPDVAITLPADSALLDGSTSSDPDGKISVWQWTKVSGPASFAIINASEEKTTVKNLVGGVYHFELKVTDDKGASAKDTVQVAVAGGSVSACAIGNRPLVNAQLIPVGLLSQPRLGITVASVNNKLFFAGGTSANALTARVDIYDIPTNTWSMAELSEARAYMTAAVLGPRVFFAGGGSSRVDIHNVETNAWTTTELSQGRWLMAGGAVGTKVFFAGGIKERYATSPYPTVVDIYDVSTNRWTIQPLNRMQDVGVGIATTVIDNKIYFAGGISTGNFLDPDEDIEYANTIDIYDAVTKAWSNSRLSTAKGGMAAIAVGNKIYWAGGKNVDRFPNVLYHQQVEIRDIATGATSFDCLFQPNVSFDAVQKNNKIVFFTGAGDIKNKFDIYDTITRTWSIGVLPNNIENASIISVNNTIYIAGGLVNGVLSNQVWKLEF